MTVTDPALQLREWIARHQRIFVLTGAGVSTASGIPDYRDGDGQWKRTPPVDFRDFSKDPSVYRRYWARSAVGWPRFLAARPNRAHAAFASLERSGRMHMLLTQNVDGLHQQAGNRNVIDLHGRLDHVVCLDCPAGMSREATQTLIAALNPDWTAQLQGVAPDGDADIDGDAVEGFSAPRCPRCGGRLKPDVVFFGENVPRERFERARDALLDADALLVAGSSLMVYSGFRFARMAAESGISVAILNRGRTRADALADFKLEADISEVLSDALAILPSAPSAPRD